LHSNGNLKQPYRILIPILNQKLLADLLTLAQAVSGDRAGEAIILGVAEVQDSSFSTGKPLARAYRTLLNYMPPAAPDLRAFPAGTRPVVLHTKVKVAHSVALGIVDAAIEERADLLLLPWKGYTRSPDALYGRTCDEVMLSAPCDVILCRFAAGGLAAVQDILLAVRGGPYAEFALKIGQALMPPLGATMTVLHSGTPPAPSEIVSHWDEPFAEFEELLQGAAYRRASVYAPDPATAVLQEMTDHQLVIMGASGTLYRGGLGQPTMTQRVSAAARQRELSLLVARTRQPLELARYQRPRSHDSTSLLNGRGSLEEPVEPALDAPDLNPQARLRPVVEHWAVEHSYDVNEFADHARLAVLKERQGLHISLCLNFVAGPQKHTVELLKGISKGLLEEAKLVDEIVILDGGDGTVAELASRHGFSGYRQDEVLPEISIYAGRGSLLWKSAAVSSGDLVVWQDVQAARPTTMSIANLIGPLLEEPSLKLIIGRGTQRGENRTYPEVLGDYWKLSELAAALLRGEAGALRRLCARFYYQLAGLLEPTSGDLAASRHLLNSLPIVAGSVGVVGLILDTISHYGLNAVGQVEVARPALADGLHVRHTAGHLLNLLAHYTQRGVGVGETGRSAALREMHELYTLLAQGQRQNPRRRAYEVEERELECLELPPLGQLRPPPNSEDSGIVPASW